jgi:hypothetical protein
MGGMSMIENRSNGPNMAMNKDSTITLQLFILIIKLNLIETAHARDQTSLSLRTLF